MIIKSSVLTWSKLYAAIERNAKDGTVIDSNNKKSKKSQ